MTLAAKLRLDKSRPHSHVRPSYRGASFEQGGYYFTQEGELVAELMSDQQRDALEALPDLGDDEIPAAAPAPSPTDGRPLTFKELAAGYRGLTDVQKGQFRAITHLVEMDESARIQLENANLKRENDKLADLLAELRAGGPKDVDRPDVVFDAEPVAPPAPAPVDDDVPPRPAPAPVLHGGPEEDDGPPEPAREDPPKPALVEKPAAVEPSLDLVGWLKGEQKYRVMDVAACVKQAYGFTGAKKAIIDYLVNEKGLLPREAVAID